MMSPHPQLSNDEAEKMIRYILSINNKSLAAGLPYKGSYALNKHKPTEKDGTYIFTASYTDNGAAGGKPLTATSVVSLAYPLIDADQFKTKKKAMTFLVTKEIFAAIEEEMTIVLPSHEGVLTYGDVDLTDVGQLNLGVAVAPTYFSGGTVDIFIDSESGQRIGGAALEVGLTDLGFKELMIDISRTDGVHDLVFKFTCKDTSKIFAGVASIGFVKRKQ
jgi:cytochrome c